MVMKTTNGVLAVVYLLSGANADESQLAVTEALVAEINSKQTSWVAHASPRFSHATVGDIKRLCGTIMKDDSRYSDTLEEKTADTLWATVDAIPASFDVRTQWPKCANVSGNIRDQSDCGSCWAFGSTEAFNDRRCIAMGDTTLLSPTDTVSNCGFFRCQSMGCNGGQPGRAWHWFTTQGVVTGGNYDDIGKGDTCAPYPLHPCAHHVNATKTYPECPSKEYPTPEIGSSCSEKSYAKSYRSDKKKASTSYRLTGVEKIQQDMMQYGSATAAFTVYGDFPTYKSGVYRHVSGSQLGGHAIKFLGWGTESGDDYWLVANSWNNEWGDKGTFKILRGSDECGIEGMVTAGTVSATEPASSIVV